MSLQDQAGRKPGIGPFAYLGPKHFPRSGYVDIFPPDHWPMIPMIKPEPNPMHSDSDFHPMEKLCKLIANWIWRVMAEERTCKILMFGEVRQDFYSPGLWMNLIGSHLEIWYEMVCRSNWISWTQFEDAWSVLYLDISCGCSELPSWTHVL